LILADADAGRQKTSWGYGKFLLWPTGRGICGINYATGMAHPKRIGFLSFGHWHPAGGVTNSAADALRQSVELAVAAE
jgi:hypothetical protein